MTYFAQAALLPTGLASNVVFDVVDGRFGSVEVDRAPTDLPAGTVRLPGVVLPGFANAHSHAFHRALRGRTHTSGGGSFWTWRDAMYAVAAQLDPESYLALARATYAEMALSGVTSVGEFHYLHHAPGGRAYADPHAMSDALQQAAADAGIRLTLLDTCYLTGGLNGDGHLPLDPVQQRFSDGTVDAWAARAGARTDSQTMRIGFAAHSVRAVPQESLAAIAAVAAGRPLHVHLSEQPAENVGALAHYGCTPTQLLADSGFLAASTTAVHATHVTGDDIGLLGRSTTTSCICPTTERDLADGIGPARALRNAGSPLSLGSDQHAVIDLLEEARSLELNERLASGARGRFSQAELLDALTAHASLGWPEAGRLEAGAAADLVAVRLDSVRTAGSRPDQIVMSASAADVDTVIVGGQLVVSAGQHRLGDVAALLSEAIAPLWRDR